MTKTASIKIDRLALEGDGVGRLGATGKAAFVPYVLPDETVQATLQFEKKSYSRWIPQEITKPSAARLSPKCSYHFNPGLKKRWCGGCDWQMMATEKQRTLKQTLVVETLERLGGIKKPPVDSIRSTPQDFHYRNKVQIPFAYDESTVKAGFYSPGSHHVVDIDTCVVQSEPSVPIFKMVKTWAQGTKKNWLKHLLIRTNEAGQALVTVVSADGTFPDKKEFCTQLTKKCSHVVGIFQNVQPKKTNVILGHHWNHLWGERFIKEPVMGLNLTFSPGAFFQVNTSAAQVLYQTALDCLNATSSSLVLDLYCGVGAMTLLAAKQAGYSVGVDVGRESITSAKQNAETNQIRNVEFVATKAESFFSQDRLAWIKQNSKDCRVLLDPPRSGCEDDVLRRLLYFKPKRIVYVSCNPATLARDLKQLMSDYRLSTVIPVDMFPQTSHIEVVAQLDLLTP